MQRAAEQVGDTELDIGHALAGAPGATCCGDEPAPDDDTELAADEMPEEPLEEADEMGDDMEELGDEAAEW